MKKHALLVGVEEYRDKMISRLQFARADATALAERLRDRCGFDNVRVLADDSGEDAPDLVNIVTALRDTAGELRSEDLFLFFFAGHGVEMDGHGYLLARDSLQAFPEHGSLSLELLRKTFGGLSAGKRVLLLDACRNSPQAGRADDDNRMGDVISRDIVAAARSKPSGGTTTALLSACRSGQRAYEWPAKGHGVFTQYLIEGLDGAAWAGEVLEFEQLAGFAAKQVRQWSANTPGLPIPQEPWYEKFGDPEPVLLAADGTQAGSASVQANPVLSPKKPPAVQAKPTLRWWVTVNGQEQGPLDEAAIRDAIKRGTVTRKTECWRDGMDGWNPLGETHEWTSAFPPVQPLPEIITPPKHKATLPDVIELDCGDGVAMKCKLIPAGTFMMGSPKTAEDRFSEECPQHEVTLSRPFYMGIYPVTQAQYKAVLRKNPSTFQGDERPVENVWDDALAFCEDLSSLTNRTMSLPSEAQWEYACRAGSTTRYSFGDSASRLDLYGWYEENSGDETHPVGQKKPNAWGLYDMYGNVWEWCEDAWHGSYKNAPTDGSVWKGDGAARVVRGGCCVARGGCCVNTPQDCRSANRFRLEPDCDGIIGSRVVVDLE
jgi:hypothetical protein